MVSHPKNRLNTFLIAPASRVDVIYHDRTDGHLYRTEIR